MRLVGAESLVDFRLAMKFRDTSETDDNEGKSESTTRAVAARLASGQIAILDVAFLFTSNRTPHAAWSYEYEPICLGIRAFMGLTGAQVHHRIVDG